jgi:mRNA interferase MazF
MNRSTFRWPRCPKYGKTRPTRFMIAFEPGDIVLVRFPFTDLTATSQRPAVIVQPSGHTARYGDSVVLALTSQSQPDDVSAIEYWREAGLLAPTWIKPLIATLAACRANPATRHRCPVRRLYLSRNLVSRLASQSPFPPNLVNSPTRPPPPVPSFCSVLTRPTLLPFVLPSRRQIGSCPRAA